MQHPPTPLPVSVQILMLWAFGSSLLATYCNPAVVVQFFVGSIRHFWLDCTDASGPVWPCAAASWGINACPRYTKEPWPASPWPSTTSMPAIRWTLLSVIPAVLASTIKHDAPCQQPLVAKLRGLGSFT